VLEFPTGVVPVSVIAKEEEQQPLPSAFKDLIDKKMNENIIGSAGLPIGVQISTLPY